ncbi:MAG: rab-GTPase-TBC domain-containing protein [Linnemannia elongata]|nr:MAG: rab-GTPase-TBC domain-containing protein [Linnemannia elongata]
MNQGQDLTGTGSNIGLDGALGSNASVVSDIDRKRALKNQKYNRENEIKWIHAVSKLQADSVKKSSKYKKLVRRGIPTSVRGKVWLFLAKADVYRRPGLFEKLLKRGPLPIHEVIERDIHRCYPDHVHFRDGMGGTGQQDLHSILKAYAHYNPSVGYCQGMGRLVGMMLMQMPVEDAFWLLVATIEGYMQDYYTPTLRQLRIDAQVFERLLKDQDPALAEHLEKNDVIPLMYMTQWFMTLFTMSLPWASVLRVWDVFYYDGVKALFRVGLAILQLCRDHLLNKCPTSSELLGFILHIPLENLGPKALLETALQIKLTKHSVQKLIAVTAESMDAAASVKAKGPPSGDAFKNTQNPRKAGNTATASNTGTHSANNDTQENTTSTTSTKSQSQPTSPRSAAAVLPPNSSSPPVPSPPPPSASSNASSSFSPLGVFKTRKRAGTLHK